MPLYRYRAMDKNGKRQSGKVEKETNEQVETYLKNQSLIALDIKKLNILNKDITDFKVFAPRIKYKDLAVLCRQMAFVLDAGILIGDAMDILAEQTSGKKLRLVMQQIKDSILKGDSFGLAMQKSAYFPEFCVRMIEVGEKSGRLSFVMDKLATYYEREQKAADNLKNAMLYPALLVFMMLSVIVIFVVYITPSYSQMFAGQEALLPWQTLFIMGVSDFVTRNSWLVIIFMHIALVSAVIFFRSKPGLKAADWLKINTPFINIVYKKTLNTRFTQTLAILLDSGVDIVDSLGTIKNVVRHSIFDETIDQIISKVRQGTDLSTSMRESPFFDKMLIAMVSVGEETGALVDTLHKCADYFQDETESLYVKANKLVEPILTILLGIILGFIMMAVMLPTFSMIAII